METEVLCKEALKITKIITDLELPLSKRNELFGAIKDFALRERQEGYVDGLNRAVEILENERR